MRIFNTPSDLATMQGQELGFSQWHTITQETVNTFASTTGDMQWIHTDPERCKAESPFGTTIAHGFMLLSMAPQLMAEIFGITHFGMAVNYGLNRVRFTSHVPVGSRIRAHATLTDFEKSPQGIKITLQLRYDLEGSTKPVCVAEMLSLFL
jgi:acyl dehydratase